MRKFFLFLLPLLALTSCDDGDVITADLEFDEVLSLCGDIDVDTYKLQEDNYVVYDTQTDANESLILLFSGSSTNDLIFFPEETPYTTELIINGSSTRFNYRTYNTDPTDIICEDITSFPVSIINDYEAESGTVNISSSYVDTDGTRTVTITFEIENASLSILNSDLISFGTYTNTYIIPD